jgi:hypothetical protein
VRTASFAALGKYGVGFAKLALQQPLRRLAYRLSVSCAIGFAGL